jgi:HSP20 family protein
MARTSSFHLDPLLRLQDQLQRAFERPMGRWHTLSGPSAFPPVNVFEGSDGYVVKIEVPGLSPEDIAIETQGTTLRVRGSRKPPEVERGSFHRRERWSGEFNRAVELPEEADPARAEASYDKGILVIHVPRRAEAARRRIAITGS